MSIEDCIITQFGQQGILDLRTGRGTKLFVKNTTVSLNTGSGIGLGAAATSNTMLDHVHSIDNLYGVSTATGNNVMIRNSVFSGNGTGVEGDDDAALNVESSSITGNGTGVSAGGTIRLSSSDVSFNTTGFSGAAVSYGNNRFLGNTAFGTAVVQAGGPSSNLCEQ